MIVCIGSRGESKIGAVGRAFSKYSYLWSKSNDKFEINILPKNFEQEKTAQGKVKKSNVSDVSNNPMTLEETVLGAKNRARLAWEYFNGKSKAPDFSVGIEGGCFQIDNEWYMTCAAAIYNSKDFCVGLSPTFAVPKVVMDGIFSGTEMGYLGNIFGVESLKGRNGICNQLTQGRFCREDMEENAVLMALTQIVNEVYKH